MLNRIDPARLVAGDQLLDRRSALFGLGALAGSAGLAGCAPAENEPPAEAGTPRKSLNLDFSKPDDNLTAWVKLVSSLEDGVETCGYFAGTQYSVIGTQEVIQPLFRRDVVDAMATPVRSGRP